MHGLVIATAWIAFAAILASVILYVFAGKYNMKADATDADRAKARQLGMSAFWVMIVGAIFILIAAISASCGHPNMRKVFRQAMDMMQQRQRLSQPLA
jgi:heme/copper-type cytochrome/quinol oxidase subunit 2